VCSYYKPYHYYGTFSEIWSRSAGYYNPMRAYGEREAIRDARECGANGFIMVDLPPEEAIKFRELCTEEG